MCLQRRLWLCRRVTRWWVLWSCLVRCRWWCLMCVVCMRWGVVVMSFVSGAVWGLAPELCGRGVGLAVRADLRGGQVLTTCRNRLLTLTGRTLGEARLSRLGQFVSTRSRAVPFPTSSRTSPRPPTASETTSAPHNPLQGSCGALFVASEATSSCFCLARTWLCLESVARIQGFGLVWFGTAACLHARRRTCSLAQVLSCTALLVQRRIWRSSQHAYVPSSCVCRNPCTL